MTFITTRTNYGNGQPELALAQWTQTMKRSVLREMLAVVSQPGILSFAGGLPEPELFPTAEYAQAVSDVLTSDPLALQYGPPYAPLKRQIVDLMAQRGVQCHEEQVFLTTGAQQALNVLGRLFLNPGGQVLLEEIVYSGIQQVVAPYRPEILTVSTDLEFGMDTDKVAEYLRAGARPAFIYAISEAHNPLGVNLSKERQEQLLDLAKHYGIPIIEDDPYGFLQNPSAESQPMRALDDQWVFYVGSFSKILAPALRLGWLIVPERLMGKLTVIKESYDLETSAFVQRTVSAYIKAGHLPAHFEKLSEEYGRRRQAMLAALEQHFPKSARWTRPTGGMFIWVELPDHMKTAELLWSCVEDIQVAFIPGAAFNVASGSAVSQNGHLAENCLRLNFSNSTPNQINQGIAQLGKLLRRVC
jgi:2-aminoadipate transaminase